MMDSTEREERIQRTLRNPDLKATGKLRRIEEMFEDDESDDWEGESNDDGSDDDDESDDWEE